VKKERKQRLDAIQQRISMDQHASLKGETVEVLFESTQSNRRDLEQWHGRTRQNRLVFVPRGEDDLIGKLVTVRVEKVSPFAMQGAVA
jgi:tRNA A37 methylthiotransferase MiaB